MTAGILPVLVDVVHLGLGGRQRGAVVPAVPEHPESGVDQALVPQGLERPDDALHVVQVERLVVVLEVDPAGLAGDVGLPLVGVAQHGAAAGVVERRDAHLLDLGLVLDAELVLGLDLGGQPVGVPAEAALDVPPAHGPVARHDVLDVAGEQVAVVRQAVGEGRAVVEDELVAAVVARPAGPRSRPGTCGRRPRSPAPRVRARGRTGVPGQRDSGCSDWSAVMAVGSSCGVGRSACTGTTPSQVPRYHPACRRHVTTSRRQPAAPHRTAVTGRTRPVLLRAVARFFRRLPGDGRIGACETRVAPYRHPIFRRVGSPPAQPTPAAARARAGERSAGRGGVLLASRRFGVHQAHGVKPSSIASLTGQRDHRLRDQPRQSAMW